MTNIIMPQMGESVTEGVITTWYKRVGEWVDKDEPLLSITTDKVDADVPSPAAGYLSQVAFEEGATVEIDTVIATLSASLSESGQVAPAIPSLEEKKNAKDLNPAAEDPKSQAVKPEPVDDVEHLRKTRSSPLVRKMAAAEGVDIGELKGTGVSGRVTKKDFERYLIEKTSLSHKQTLADEMLAKPGLTKTTPAGPLLADKDKRWLYRPIETDRLEPFSPVRASIADHMLVSRQTSAHVTTVFEVDMTKVAKLRSKHKDSYKERGSKLSFMPFIIKAVSSALVKFPVVNSAVVDRSIAYRRDINIGMAVALDWGLLVPVIRNADEKSLLGLSRSVNELAAKARERKLGPDDLANGTFTITNPGVFGSLFGTPIINQPQVAILCVGAITKRPIVTEDDAIAIRHMMYLALSFDHRIIDGATGDRFMKSIKDELENFPEDLL